MALIKQANSGTMAREAIVLDLGDLRRQGDQLLQHARTQAKKIIDRAEAEREKLIATAAQAGKTEGLAEGLAQGHREGMAQGYQAALNEKRADLEKLTAAWSGALEQFVAHRQRMLDDARRDILRLAALIASRVVKRTVELEPTVVQDQLDAVLAMVLRPTRLRVRVNAQDVELTKAALPTLMQKYAGAVDVEITGDESLSRGSCVASLAEPTGETGEGSTASGRIDASIGTQLDRIVLALLPDRDERAGADKDVTNA